MNRKTAAIAIVIAVIFVISGIASYRLKKTSKNQCVEIVREGEVLYRFDLSETEDQTITIISEDGSSSNTVSIKNGGIYMSDAECPDKTCVKTGVLKSEGLPIVCLPNKLIIRFCED